MFSTVGFKGCSQVHVCSIQVAPFRVFHMETSFAEFRCSKSPKSDRLLLCDLLALCLWRRRLGGSLRLDHAHLLFIFLEQRCATHLAGLLLAGDARTHFLGEIQSRPHLTFTRSGRLPQLLHGLTHLTTHHALQFIDRGFHHARQILEGAANGDLRFDGLEFALKSLNLTQTLGNDTGVLLIELSRLSAWLLLSARSCSRVANSSA